VRREPPVDIEQQPLLGLALVGGFYLYANFLQRRRFF